MAVSRGKRLWFVTEPFYPEDEGVGWFMSRAAFECAASHPFETRSSAESDDNAETKTKTETQTNATNVSIGAICTQPSYARKGTHCVKHETYRDVEIFRCATTMLDRQKIVNRLVNLTTMCLSMFCCMLRQVRRGDVVLVASSPPMLPFLAVIACRVKRAKCIIRLYDLYPEIAVVVGLLKPTSRLTRWTAKLRNFFYRRADAILVLGRDMEKFLREKLDPSEELSPTSSKTSQKRKSLKLPPIHYVPLFVDTQDIRPTPRTQNVFLNELGLQEKFVVQIAGNLGFVHDVELFLAAAKALEDTPDIHFLLFSSGKKIPLIERVVSEERRTNITIHPRLPRERTAEIVNACDLAISSLFLPGMYGLASPSRTYGILAAGKPVLALTEARTEVDLQIQENGIGWTVLPHDLSGFVAAIRDAYSHREELAAMGRAARQTAEAKYTPDRIIRQIADVIAPYLT